MVTLLLSLTLAAASPPSLALVGLTPVDVPAKRADAFSEYLGEQLSRQGVQVTTQSAMQAVLGLERQKQLLGCSDGSTACLAEIGSALGVDGIVVGSLASTGGTGFVVTLRIVSAKNGETWASDSGRVASEAELLDFLQASAARLALTVHERLGRAPPTTGPGLGRIAGWSLVGAGAVAEAVSLGLFVSAKNTEARLLNKDATIGDGGAALALANQGRSFQTIAAVTAGVGAAAIAGGVVLLLLQRSDVPAVGLAPTHGGAVVTWHGSLP